MQGRLVWSTQNADTRNALRLFCFPYAGGSSIIYRNWSQHAPGWLHMCAIELPGRGRLRNEPAPSSLPALADELASALYPYTDHPFALFGHSMGALIAYEVACRLEAFGRKQLQMLFVSGARAPYLPPNRPPMSDLPDDAFIDRLRELDGTPVEVLENRELMDYMMPVLRADFAMCERYRLQRPNLLRVPVSVLYGSEDDRTPKQEVDAWRLLTTGSFSSTVFSGGHFFINSNERAIVDSVVGELKSLAFNENLERSQTN
ncbi:thioesterase II family protein [Trinickia mobilis]|uniref:thioesterase II family protein n=1 Tax=Trinickia mobilis TaxID=2816356 RepID=UPI001A8CB8A6|nr:alpha/beta fold hydrolase [Trinickia mobilis]